MAKRKRFTPAYIESIKPPEAGRIEVWDTLTPAFGLRVSARGIKTFQIVTRVGRTRKRITLGRYPTMSVKEARQIAGEEFENAKKGIDTNSEKRRKNKAEKAALDRGEWLPGTFGELAENYIKLECPRLKRGWEIESRIRRELLTQWGDRPVNDLRKRDGIAITDAIVARGHPTAANGVQGLIRRIFNWALSRDEIDASPFGGMKPPAEKIDRDRVLVDDEIRAIWNADLGYPFGPMIRFLLSTGQRRSEVAGMQWSEIDEETKIWTVPKERVKAKRDNIVPLSGLAWEILETLPRFTGPYVFSTTDGEKAISGFSKAKRRADELSGISDWRIHDLRRTCRTRLAKLRVPELVAELVLNHDKKGLQAIYNQHQYIEEKAEALEAWGRMLADIVNATERENVVPLHG